MFEPGVFHLFEGRVSECTEDDRAGRTRMAAGAFLGATLLRADKKVHNAFFQLSVI